MKKVINNPCFPFTFRSPRFGGCVEMSLNQGLRQFSPTFTLFRIGERVRHGLEFLYPNTTSFKSFYDLEGF